MKKYFVLLFLFVLTLSLFAEGKKETYYGEEGKITVYLSGPANMLNKLEVEFEKEQGDVLDFVQLGCGPLRQRVWTEMEAGQIRADVFWGSDPLVYNALDQKGALEAYQPMEIDKVKKEFLTDKNYILVNERYGVVIYNTDKLSGASVPDSYNSLLNPKLKDLIIQADPAQSSTALAITASLWSLEGENWEFYSALIKDQGLCLTKKNSDVPSRIQEGEFLAGIAPHDAVLRLQEKAKKEGYPMPLAICWPKEGAMAIVRPIAISRNEARPEVNAQIARNFVDFMLSKKAQYITTQFGFISVREDVPMPKSVPEDIEINRMDWDMLAGNQEEIRQEFNALFE